MRTLTMVLQNLRMTFRYRPNWFFLFIMPMTLIFVMGAAAGGYVPKIAVVGTGGTLGADLIERIERSDRIQVISSDSEDEVRSEVERGNLAGGLVLPDGYDRRLRAGETVELVFIARPEQMALRATVDSAVAGQNAEVRAARFAKHETGAGFDDALAQASRLARRDTGVTVSVTTVGEAANKASAGSFDLQASQMLILFLFLTALMGATELIEARRLGLVRRIMSTPTSPRSILLGESLGRIAVSLLQVVVIMGGSALLFGVDWGDPVAAAFLVLSFVLVASGASMLLGSVLRTEQQAIAVGLLVGLGMAGLGGAMVPSELFSETMQRVSRITPHSWALDGFAELVGQGAGIGGILPQAGVLLGAATVLLLLASWRLRRAVTA